MYTGGIPICHLQCMGVQAHSWHNRPHDTHDDAVHDKVARMIMHMQEAYQNCKKGNSKCTKGKEECCNGLKCLLGPSEAYRCAACKRLNVSAHTCFA